MKKLLILLIGLMAGAAQAQRLERANPEGLPKNPNYSQVVKAGKLVFVAGQVGVQADGKVIGPGMREQFEQALANVATALKSQGADLSHVAAMTTYVTDMEAFRDPQVIELRQKHFGRNMPASTLLQVVRLASPEYKVEIQVMAVLP